MSTQFRELELEELGQTPQAGRDVVARLSDSGAVTGELMSKAARALGAQASVPSEVPEPEDVGPDDPASATVRAFIAQHTRALRRADLTYRRDPDGVSDSVHQMRVAARRLRSGPRVFRSLLDREWAGSRLGEVRELEVLIARLEKRIAALPADAVPDDPSVSVMGRIREPQARGRVAVLLASDRYLELHERLGDGRRAEVVLEDESGLPGGAPDPEWHQVRIAAKRARYAGEAVAQVLGEEAAAFARQMEKVTEILSEHQDAADDGAAIRELATSPDAPASFTLGVLHAADASGLRRPPAGFATLWPKVSRGKWRRWLT